MFGEFFRGSETTIESVGSGVSQGVDGSEVSKFSLRDGYCRLTDVRRMGERKIGIANNSTSTSASSCSVGDIGESRTLEKGGKEYISLRDKC